ncbi:MAG: hypothetical protein IJH39_02015 [Clostridia bacterium]|nr:hypothetical protein [Clostridia bacterium]
MHFCGCSRLKKIKVPIGSGTFDYFDIGDNEERPEIVYYDPSEKNQEKDIANANGEYSITAENIGKLTEQLSSEIINSANEHIKKDKEDLKLEEDKMI